MKRIQVALGALLGLILFALDDCRTLGEERIAAAGRPNDVERLDLDRQLLSKLDAPCCSSSATPTPGSTSTTPITSGRRGAEESTSWKTRRRRGRSGRSAR